MAMAETAEWRRSFVKSGQGSDVLEVEPPRRNDMHDRYWLRPPAAAATQASWE